RLEVWHSAVELARLVYQVTLTLPPEEKYGLTAQLRRAAVSVSANIAEGSGRPSPRDFAHFLDQAYGSDMEVVSLVEVAARLGWIRDDVLAQVRSLAAKVAAMLSGLRKSVLADSP
ncbi:MAG TPA: four helix bundle protein, partial [Verrucomicrobiota bacterium]|nr:four helix bundle protein [Verrucomicrobiota bacterium]